MTRGRIALLRVGPIALTIAVGTALLMATLAIASAPAVQVNDGRDVRGRLDVERVSLDPGTDTPEWTIHTFASLRPSQLWDRGFVVVFLDTMGTPRSDYYALIRSSGSSLDGSLWRDRRTGRDWKLGSLAVTRGSGDQVAVRIPLGRIQVGASRPSFGWWVVTMYTGDTCRRTCIDHVPDQGAISQDLATPSPTGTPTASPTASPTTSPTTSSTPSPTA